MTWVAVSLIVALCFREWLISRERDQWMTERQLLLTRIQAPQLAPELSPVQAPDFPPEWESEDLPEHLREEG